MSDVILIEPDVVLAKTYVHALTSSGLTVVDFGDAQSAITQLDKKLPQVIVMELQLGEHNGVEFLYEMRSYPEWSTIPVIILSRLSEAELGLHPSMQTQLGIAAYYYKPQTNLKELIATVKQAIDR